MTATCALCGSRDSSGLTDYDGRLVPACDHCLAPPAEPVLSRTAVTGKDTRSQLLGLLRSNGALTAAEVSNLLHVVGQEDRLVISQTLWRMAHEGALEIDRDARPQEYRVKRRAA